MFSKSLRLGKAAEILGVSRRAAVTSEISEVSEEPRPFDSIPGPKSFPLIGTLWKYLPKLGEYKFDRLHHNGALKLKQYGSIVREDIVPGVSVLWLFDADAIEHLFRVEGRHPERRSHLALQKYRLDNPHIYSSGGLLPTNGLEWYRLRKEFQKPLSRIQNVRQYLSRTDEIIKDFLNTRVTDKKEFDDFLPELSRLFLELTCLVAFDEPLHSYSDSELKPASRSSLLINSTATINSCILKTDNGPQLWKKFETPMYRKLKKAHQYLDKVALEYVHKKQEYLKTSNKPTPTSLLEQYLSNLSLTTKDVTGMVADMLLAGIDTMSYTSSFGLYHLATNEDKQTLMRKELRKLLRYRRYPITEYHFDKAEYTKCVLKEIFRMNPISVGIGRILPTHATFTGYTVPPGTVVVTQNQVSCRLPFYFQNPDKFIPERWLKGDEQYSVAPPFLVLPFGHGPRSCIARRLAEQNLQLLLMNVVRRYKIAWKGEPLDSRSLLINKPDKPVKIEFLPL